MMQQDYAAYTRDDFQIWKILFDRQIKVLEEKACQKYLDGIDILGFNKSRIPEFSRLNPILEECTGWGLEVVPNMITGEQFFSMLARKRFPATTWLRNMEQLDYLEEPDMFHDVFGHVPLLTNQEYCDFVQGVGQIAMDNLANESVIRMVKRVYWWTIEFGMMREENELKIYGAGLVSSIGEAKYSMTAKPVKHDFSVQAIVESDYRVDSFQPKYFVIDSFDQLFDSLPEMQRRARVLAESVSDLIEVLA